jgi:heme exporter protein D
MNNNDTLSDWSKVALAFGCWLAGHVTLSGFALVMSILVAGLQGYKLIREIRRDRRMERLEAKLKHETMP